MPKNQVFGQTVGGGAYAQKEKAAALESRQDGPASRYSGKATAGEGSRLCPLGKDLYYFTE